MTTNSPDSFELLSLPKPFDRHVFSIDVEEWYQVGAYENTLSRSDWPSLEKRVEYQMDQLLDMLASVSTKATLFTLGSVAKASPRLLRRAAAAGHEIACHGLDHRRLYDMSEKEILCDIRDAKSALEDACSAPVLGYRAPSFSLTPDVWHTYETLADLGFAYSSSLYPLKTDHYGMPSAPTTPFFPTQSKRIVELPVTVADVFGRRVPAAGGGYFRLMPSLLGRWLFFKGARQAQVPGMFYMHPWEVDPGQPKVPEAPFKARFRHSVNQSRMLGKVENLLRKASFGPVRDVVLPPLRDQLTSTALFGEG